MPGTTADELLCEGLLLPRCSCAIDLKFAGRFGSVVPAGPGDGVATGEMRDEDFGRCAGDEID